MDNMQELFVKNIEGLCVQLNSYVLSKDNYEKFLIETIAAEEKKKEKKPLDSLEKRRLARFCVMKIGEEEKLIAALIKTDGAVRYFVTKEECYGILKKIHEDTGHGRRDRMLKELSVSKYANISRAVVMEFLKLCMPCEQKSKNPKKGIVVKPIISNTFNERGQVDLIDFQSTPDGEYKFVLNYQDHMTKFTILKALKKKTAEEVAENLIDIFSLIGAPAILHSDNGGEFVNRIITAVANKWPDLKLVHGKPRHSQSQGSVERSNQDVEAMIATYIAANKTTNWSQFLKFIQFKKNNAFHSGKLEDNNLKMVFINFLFFLGINQSPFEALFGIKSNFGLHSTSLPTDVVNSILTEVDLDRELMKIKSQLPTTVVEGCSKDIIQNSVLSVDQPIDEISSCSKDIIQNSELSANQPIGEVSGCGNDIIQNSDLSVNQPIGEVSSNYDHDDTSLESLNMLPEPEVLLTVEEESTISIFCLCKTKCMTVTHCNCKQNKVSCGEKCHPLNNKCKNNK